jgi:uncharacterized membrane protein
MYEEIVNLIARFLGLCGAAVILYGGMQAVVHLMGKRDMEAKPEL